MSGKDEGGSGKNEDARVRELFTLVTRSRRLMMYFIGEMESAEDIPTRRMYWQCAVAERYRCLRVLKEEGVEW